MKNLKYLGCCLSKVLLVGCSRATKTSGTEDATREAEVTEQAEASSLTDKWLGRYDLSGKLVDYLNTI